MFLRAIVGVPFYVIPYRVNLFKSLYITRLTVGRLGDLLVMESHVYTLYIYLYIFIYFTPFGKYPYIFICII